MTVFYPTGPRSCSQLSSSACASDQVRSARNGEESFKPGNGNENQYVMYRFLVTKELPAFAHCLSLCSSWQHPTCIWEVKGLNPLRRLTYQAMLVLFTWLGQYCPNWPSHHTSCPVMWKISVPFVLSASWLHGIWRKERCSIWSFRTGQGTWNLVPQTVEYHVHIAGSHTG